ncbi:unnamed protein product [Rhizophagus irregularis]|uniref:Protein kinase domain-containing protein n=1 Tax=Rhizophagus irregularis TaxID=588596 RepID=A0A915Z382_9GLOM|nr:unnamed protein product [Rhizophagus irregularis]
MGRLRYSYTCGVCNFKTKTIPCTKCTKYERHNNFDSGYKNVDDMIIASQSHAKDDRDFLEWIEFSQLRILETLDEGGFGTVYKAKWLDGLPMDASDVGRAWNRSHFNYVVAVKFFHNNKDFLKEFTNIYKMVRKFSEENEFPSNIVHYYGATYDYDNEHYAKQISNGLRPKVYQEDGIPRCFVNLMRNCWNSDVRSRPNAYTLYEKFNSWIEYSEAFEDMEWNITEPSIYHRKAVYTSRSWWQ